MRNETATARVVLAGLPLLYAGALAHALRESGDGLDVEVVGVDEVGAATAAGSAAVLIIGEDGAGRPALAAMAGTARATAQRAHVVLVTSTIDLELALHAEERGIDAIVPADAPLSYLLDVIEFEVRSGGGNAHPQPPANRSPAAHGLRRLEVVTDRPALTPRELEVLELLAQGLGAQAIAARVDLSVHTVRDHIKGVLRKLSVHSQLEAVAAATRRGLV